MGIEVFAHKNINPIQTSQIKSDANRRNLLQRVGCELIRNGAADQHADLSPFTRRIAIYINLDVPDNIRWH